ncbi:MAG TPA: signal peptidase I [Microlunatus sp.]|nr:signal peptidase I [Microlunatus sp.]
MTTETTAQRRGGGSRFASFVRELLIVVVGALVVSSLLRAFVGQMFIIPSESMENTLLVGDRVVVQKITDPQRGDVVVFEDPGGWLDSQPAADPGPLDKVLEFIGFPTASSPEHLIKRVIGMPGDRVVCCDTNGRITVNGRPLDETGYLYTDPDGVQVAPSDIDFDVTVPSGRIFVMGDHRDLSADSRCHLSDLSVNGPKGSVAFVPLDKVVGPAFAIAAPFSRAEVLHRPETFASVPAPTEPAPKQAVIEPDDVTC